MGGEIDGAGKFCEIIVARRSRMEFNKEKAAYIAEEISLRGQSSIATIFQMAIHRIALRTFARSLIKLYVTFFYATSTIPRFNLPDSCRAVPPTFHSIRCFKLARVNLAFPRREIETLGIYGDQGTL